MKYLFQALVLFAGVAQGVEPVGFDRYQVILDRSPFGTPSLGGPAAPAPGWAEAFTFTGIVPDPASTNVLAIIQDKERAYLKGAGETIGDVTVKEIVVEGKASRIVLQRGIEAVPLRFRDQSAGVPTLPMPAGLPPGVTPAGPILKPAAAGGAQPTVVPPRRRIPFRRGD